MEELEELEELGVFSMRGPCWVNNDINLVALPQNLLVLSAVELVKRYEHDRRCTLYPPAQSQS
jgi:hypothetical protein